MAHKLLLASQSPRRIQMLEDLGYELDVRPQDIDESPHSGEHPRELVARLAREKCFSAFSSCTQDDVGMPIVAADTIVWMDNLELGKPSDDAEAKRMLRLLSGREHTVSTGVCIMRAGSTRHISFTVDTKVQFYELDNEFIDQYVASGEPLDKAGAYGYQQGLGRLLVKRIEGDFYNVIGLPVGELVRRLKEL